jgi:maltokinase
MLLVEGKTGIATQSYATDNALLAELRVRWPLTQAAAAHARESGFVPVDLAAIELAAAIRLTDRFGVAFGVDGAEDGTYIVMPIVREAEATWRPAVPGDGLSAFVAGVPMASERPIATDQTNFSVVVGERAIVKWFRRTGPGPSRSSWLVAHLAAVGYPEIPAPLGALTWQSPTAAELTLAEGAAFLPDARDGWDWCVTRLEAHVGHDDGPCPAGCDPSIGGPLGRLVAGLHVALAMPSDVVPEPVAMATPADRRNWAAAATATLDKAVALEVAERTPELEALASPIRNVLATIATEHPTPTQPIHGDLHVGQILEWSGGFAIIDFDGNPALGDGSNALRQPAARDVAQMTTSLDHVGRVVGERVAAAALPRVTSWIAETTAAFLDAYKQGLESVGRGALFDETLLAPFEVEQECRELVYAARFLPRWRYAPMAALRARFRGR